MSQKKNEPQVPRGKVTNIHLVRGSRLAVTVEVGCDRLLVMSVGSDAVVVNDRLFSALMEDVRGGRKAMEETERFGNFMEEYFTFLAENPEAGMDEQMDFIDSKRGNAGIFDGAIEALKQAVAASKSESP